MAIYSSFLQRAYDQLIHDVAIQNLPVIFAIDRAGIVGADGTNSSRSVRLKLYALHSEYDDYERRQTKMKCVKCYLLLIQ